MKQAELTPKEMAKALENGGKKVISLIIKQTYFDQIIAGTKKQEFRELKPSTFKKLVQTDAKTGELKLDENEFAIPIWYDAMLLFVGYNKVRDSALVEIKGAKEEVFKDENGEEIYEEFEDGSRFYPSQIVYDLGNVLAKEIHPKK